MSKHTRRQVSKVCFPTCVLLPCLSPQFAFFSYKATMAKEKEYFYNLGMVTPIGWGIFCKTLTEKSETRR